jgi:phosphohistidine phosphatase
MKQILLLRHAKSSWKDETLDDYDRPLAKRGLRDAPMMGKFIKKSGHNPDQIFCSSAQRAKETCELVLNGMKADTEIITWNKDLYYGSETSYLEAIRSAKESSDRIMLVGHNPKIENTVGTLIATGGVANLRMPTAALVCVSTFATSWDRVNWGSCQLTWMMIPKALKHI